MKQTIKNLSTPWMLVVFFIYFFCHQQTGAGIVFEDVTHVLNFADTTRSFGAAWGDFNGDGYPDLFANNHQKKPCLFLNQGDGTFEEVYDVFSYLIIDAALFLKPGGNIDFS